MRGGDVFALWFGACVASVGSAQSNVAPGTILDGPSGDGIWHWIEVEPARNSATGWVTIAGVADVKISGSKFHAELKPNPSESSEGLSLDGRITSAGVNIMLNTDANPMIIYGTIHRTRFVDDITEE